MGVSFYNFADLHHSQFKEKIKKRIENIIENNSFVEGPYNQQFEEEFARLQKVKHCLLVANGTDALEISLKVLGIGPGHKVGVPGITFYATAEAILNIGAEPVFIDVDPIAGLICPESVKRVHNKFKLDAIMPVHIYGLPAPIEALEAVCRPLGIKIVEDAAQAQGTFYDSKQERPVGSSENLTTFSFYPTKNLSAFGDAGCILTNDDELAKKIMTERNHGRGNENSLGRNSRCDHIQAAVLHLKLEEVNQFNVSRKKIASWYHETLNEQKNIKILPQEFIPTSSWHLYPIQLENSSQREELQKFLKDQDIGSTPFYEKTLSQELPLKKYSGEDTNSKEFAGRTLCLPMNPFLTENCVQAVSKAVFEYFT